MAKANEKDFNKEIASKIRELRKANGYSSYENFCWDNDFPTRTYFRMENGENITMRNFLRVLKIFNVTPEEFFKGIK
jgi:transcriptional regulator with XRE-family HTH domain